MMEHKKCLEPPTRFKVPVFHLHPMAILYHNSSPAPPSPHEGKKNSRTAPGQVIFGLNMLKKNGYLQCFVTRVDA